MMNRCTPRKHVFTKGNSLLKFCDCKALLVTDTADNNSLVVTINNEHMRGTGWFDEVQDCTLEQPHEGPCNGWPCAYVRSLPCPRECGGTIGDCRCSSPSAL